MSAGFYTLFNANLLWWGEVVISAEVSHKWLKSWDQENLQKFSQCSISLSQLYLSMLKF